MNGKIIQVLSNKYLVDLGDALISTTAKKTLRKDIMLMVGDNVELTNDIISNIKTRSNSLIRPYVANLDICLIVISKVPAPDFLLVDKITLNCLREGIEPIICLNKSDLTSLLEIETLLSGYKNNFRCISVSADTKDGLESIFSLLENGKIMALAGQSAVGKTSLLNALTAGNHEVGDLSRKVQRGKNTTRHTALYSVGKGYIVDTCGFSMLECIDIDEEELAFYYEDFLQLSSKCKFTTCKHISEPSCAVKAAVDSGEINKDRYLRYVKLYNELKINKKGKYE